MSLQRHALAQQKEDVEKAARDEQARLRAQEARLYEEAKRFETDMLDKAKAEMKQMQKDIEEEAESGYIRKRDEGYGGKKRRNINQVSGVVLLSFALCFLCHTN